MITKGGGFIFQRCVHGTACNFGDIFIDTVQFLGWIFYRQLASIEAFAIIMTIILRYTGKKKSLVCCQWARNNTDNSKLVLFPV